ncbi:MULTISPECIES: DUF2510 domain-containing protein [unclassified Mycobacterium]|uniref:DUF2510 domain-containing protein n=1 Tax=unclassified Mycobacterium TaxID=2642494 RepID=UPI000801A930|nr:hypothetical protein A5703_04760 [Mycobacterium sp. E188]OBG63306.1 hypothetical protein A5704_01930 [Mycobacterium sp. E735]OBG76072.1 hypothetical protein A5701_20245 [Mycobacterium sp. E3305]OBH10027.1 hypothetical protein A9X03_03570 [Mycobacterium sp. E1715]OBH35517.1 hypothetical protein A5691_06500 [Mycobacterium sp. E183]
MVRPPTCAGRFVVTDPYRQFSVRLIEHIGAVIFWQQRSYAVTGTLEQCERAYRSAQTQNLLAGWWSLLSLLVLNWVALVSNWNAMRQVRKLAALPPGAAHVPAPPPAAGPPPGWYGDPSGPGHRYWDGVRWTPWTNPPGFPAQGR